MATEQESVSKPAFLIQWIYRQLFTKLPYPDRKFNNQTIIVTGSNTGLGLEAARHFVRLNAAKVILAVRSVAKGDEAAASILKSENRPGVVEVWELDLASYESTKKFAARAKKELQRLDVVVSNAGVFLYDFELAGRDELTITVNVVNTFLLGIMLLPKLRETSVANHKETVLTFVGSFVHLITSFPESNATNIFEELSNQETARMTDRYNVSKSMELFLVRELAERMTCSIKQGNVVTSIVDPGSVATSIDRNNHDPLFHAFMFVFKPIMFRTAEEGSRTLVSAAYGGQETHGKFLSNCSIGKVARYIVDERGAKIQKQLWAELSRKLEEIEPGVMSFV